MPLIFPNQASAIFVCRSEADLHTVCEVVQQLYILPNFRYAEHSTWAYGAAMGHNVGFNITKTDRLDTIQQWIPSVAADVNYQIILYLSRAYDAHTAKPMPTDNEII